MFIRVVRLLFAAMKKDSEPEYVSPEETRYAITFLSAADHIRLVLIARALTVQRLRGSILEADDLLQDALKKTLEGRRRWRKGVTLVRHLDRVMESDSSHEAERRKVRRGFPTYGAVHEPIGEGVERTVARGVGGPGESIVGILLRRPDCSGHAAHAGGRVEPA